MDKTIQERIDAAMANQACTDLLNEVPYNDPDMCSTEEEINERVLAQLRNDEEHFKIERAIRESNQRRTTSKIIYHDFRIGQ